MKKWNKILAAMMLFGMLFTLAACGSQTFTCDLCMETKNGKKHSAKEEGVEVTLCDDCYQELQAFMGN